VGSTPALDAKLRTNHPLGFIDIMNMMSQLELRLAAIALVIAHRSVLADDEYVDAMRHATRLSQGPNGTYDEIAPAIFGGNEKANLFAERLERRMLIHAILMEDKAPKWLRENFVREWDRDDAKLDILVDSWNNTMVSFEGAVKLTKPNRVPFGESTEG
jgi:hypothetical protein